MRFGTRTFLWSFIPFAFLLTGSFWAIQKLTVSSVRDEMRSSLRRTQRSMAQVRSRSEIQNSRFLKMVADNAPLKAGLQLLVSEPKSGDARRTVEDQLRQISESLRFDFLLAADSKGRPIAGVIRVGDQLAAMDVARTAAPPRGFYTVGAITYQVTSVEVDQADDNIGTLSVGEVFDFAEINTPAVLTRNGKVLKSSIPGVESQELEIALKGCSEQSDCELRLSNQSYLSLPLDSISFGNGYVLRSLQSLDSATGPLQSILRNVFFAAGFGALLAALILSAVSSRSIVRPISEVVTRLREGAQQGTLPEFKAEEARIQEIRQLMESFNRAAAAIREGDENLHRAYIEFVGSLASALDARDRYTAGHSRRVSIGSCAVAECLQASSAQIDEIRIGALLHDIGKIGISDSVLQKAGRLSEEEFALIKQHPTIGRRILQGVHGFEVYLPVVELHHENWDGTGYPLGLAGEDVPLAARIVHVVDAYDAMTSDRPYRDGMTHERAIAELEKYAGSQFDPAVVRVFVALPEPGGPRRPAAAELSADASLRSLAEAVESEFVPLTEWRKSS